VKPFAFCGRFYPRTWLLIALVVGLSIAGASYYRLRRNRRVAVLNSLRDDINAHYGYRNGAPCINWGPCGRFAKAFREQWNARFREKINIAFVMAPVDQTWVSPVLGLGVERTQRPSVLD
jgi:hypothetical protein